MAIKKTASKKKASKTGKPKPKSTGKSKSAPKVSVHARYIKTGRDMNVGDTITIDNRQFARVTSPQAFVAELQKVRQEIATLKQSPELSPAELRRVELVEADIVEAIGEAQRPQPLGARITATLTGAKAVMDSMSGSVASAVGLGATLAAFGQVALKLFGG